MLLTALVAWGAVADRLPALSDRWDVALVALLVFPATFLVVWLLLPLSTARGLLPIALAAGVLAVLLDLAGLESAFNVTKVVAFTLVGFWFVQMLEALSWVVLVAAIIPWVDIVSVYRGPTKVIVEQQPGTFDRIAIAFPVPERRRSAAGPAGRDLLRPVPRGLDALRPSTGGHVDRDDGCPLPDARRHLRARPERPARAARSVARVRAPERGPPVAGLRDPRPPEHEGS